MEVTEKTFFQALFFLLGERHDFLATTKGSACASAYATAFIAHLQFLSTLVQYHDLPVVIAFELTVRRDCFRRGVPLSSRSDTIMQDFQIHATATRPRQVQNPYRNTGRRRYSNTRKFAMVFSSFVRGESHLFLAQYGVFGRDNLQSRRPSAPFQQFQPICRSWNRGKCAFNGPPRCRFRHICDHKGCSQVHMRTQHHRV